MLTQAWNRPQYQALYYTQKGLALQGLGRPAEACAAFLEAIKNIEGLRGRTSGERTSFFESGLLGGYSRAYRGMVGVLAEMAQKGGAGPAGLKSLWAGPRGRSLLFCRVHQGPSAAGSPGGRGGPGELPSCPRIWRPGKRASRNARGPGSPEVGAHAGTQAKVRIGKNNPQRNST